ncbi:hypothetical protein GCM10028864_24000 [Microlunatus parietis]
MVTETDEVAAAIAVARDHWPAESDSPARLLLRLVQAGRRTLEDEDRLAVENRRARIRDHAGSGAGLFGPDYLERLREDWPE